MPILRDIDIRLWPPGQTDSRLYKFESIEALYLDSLNNFRNDSVGKVLMLLTESLTMKGQEVQRYRYYKTENHIDVYVVFDPVKFKKLDIVARQRQALVWLQECMVEVATKFNWNLEPFEAAFRYCLERQFLYMQQKLKPLWNRSRTLHYALWATLDYERCALEVRATDREDTDVWRKQIMTFLPSRLFLYELCGSLKWNGSNALCLTSKNDRMREDQLSSTWGNVRLGNDIQVRFSEKDRSALPGQDVVHSYGTYLVDIPIEESAHECRAK